MAVYDLRPYRQSLLGQAESTTRALLLGYDAVLFLPEVSAATLFE